MSEKEKARPSAATLERASETANFEQMTIPCDNHITPPAGRQLHVADFLMVGEENAVQLQYLKTVMQLDGRSVRQLIQHERLQGAPILSSSAAGTGGYYLAATPAEIHGFARSMRARAREIEKVAQAVENAAGTSEEGGR